MSSSSDIDDDIQEESAYIEEDLNSRAVKSHASVITIAAESNRLDLIQKMVTKGYNINEKDQYGNSLLHYSVINGYDDLTTWLLTNGANINAVNNNGATPLHYSIISISSISGNVPSLMPVRGNFTSFYGIRKNPFSGKYQMHRGIDIAADEGTNIIAAADGKVLKTGWNKEFGNVVIIQHGSGIISIYGHCESVCVKQYGLVKKGTIIAKVGSTGASTGPHCHYELRYNGIAINPRFFLHDTRENNPRNNCISYLIQKGANTELKDNSGKTPIFYSTTKDEITTKKLIEQKSQVNIYDHNGLTPLHYAILSRNQNVASLLIHNGSYINAKTLAKYTTMNGKYFLKGSTPLQIAMKDENLPMAKLLLKCGGHE